MTFLRAIWADLLEKRLWPLAAVLLAALVAVPVVLAGGSAGSNPSVPVAPVPAVAARPAPAQGLVHLAGTTSASAAQRPAGAYRDPFAGRGHPSSSGHHGGAAPQAAAPAPHTAGPAPAPTPAASAPAPHPAAPVATHLAPAPAARARGYAAGYAVDVAWGHVGRATERHDLLRLTRLMAGDTPAVIYLGVRDRGRTAMFLLAPGVVPSSVHGCMPSPRDGADRCQILQLRAGSTAFVDAVVGATVARYELDVDRVVRHRAASRHAARRTLTRESHAGRLAMYELIRAGRDYVTHFMYSSTLGAVVKHDTHGRAVVAAGPQAATGR